MSWDWRKILEVLILGQFVVEKVSYFRSIIYTATKLIYSPPYMSESRLMDSLKRVLAICVFSMTMRAYMHTWLPFIKLKKLKIPVVVNNISSSSTHQLFGVSGDRSSSSVNNWKFSKRFCFAECESHSTSLRCPYWCSFSIASQQCSFTTNRQ